MKREKTKNVWLMYNRDICDFSGITGCLYLDKIKNTWIIIYKV